MIKNIFKHSTFIQDIGDVHPITMKHFDTFMDIANIITISIDHFDVKEEYKNETKLLDCLYAQSLQLENREKLYEQMADIFSIVLKKEIKYFVNDENYVLGFFCTNEEDEVISVINRDNYEELREVIMKQNLLFEPKVFKSKIKQEWAEMVLKARAKNSVDMDIEDMITTIAVISGKNYCDIEEYSIYQVKATFARINKLMSFKTNLALIGHTDKISNLHFAEKTDIHVNPYDTVFVENKKINKLEKSM